jgi:hypothetical protein
MPGPSLSFDPQYVDFVIAAWQRRDLMPCQIVDLQRLAAEHAERVFTEWSMMGLAKQQVNAAAIKSAIALLKSLKLLKQTSIGPRDARLIQLTTTPVGRELLAEKPEASNVRVGLVSLLIQQSPALKRLLTTLDNAGPLSRPVASPLPGTPSKGATFNRSVLDGLTHYASRLRLPSQPSAPSAKRPTASQALKAAITQATQRHPVSDIPSLEKLMLLAADLGLLWRDVDQINQALGVESLGTATQVRDGATIPNVPRWDDIELRFTATLARVYRQRVDSSGFATIQALRGGIGRELRLSWKAVDGLLCSARDHGERGESTLLLQFEPNDDLLYVKGRQPLIWQRNAFDFVEVQHIADAAPFPSTASSGREPSSI